MTSRKELRPYIEKRLVSEQKHPTKNLWIYNYTQKAQYENAWDETLMLCRGLILNDSGKTVAKPFKKFFNMEEHLNKNGSIPDEHFEVYEKLDGSLGILYWNGDCFEIATRGSFTSEQALKGTEILRSKYGSYSFTKNLTYLFEIIYPENRIVVDYGNAEDLILLAVFETDTEKELPLERFSELNLVKRYDGIKNLKELKAKEVNNKEGFVVKFSSGLRVKVKFAEYLRLHRLVTEMNKRRLWEYLKSGNPIDELLDRVPDEFYTWVKDSIKEIKEEYEAIEKQVTETFEKLNHLQDRRAFAREAVNYDTKAILFRMLDGRDYSELIWKRIEPTAEKPYKKEV